ncbi:MAG TPA: amidase family protein, partial [Polyangiaceae bacterium]|nr:amidase family protein [Polyangiaceae bacterium]
MPIPMNDAPLTLPFLSRAYGDSELSPASLVEEIWRRIERDRERASGVWLYVETRDRVAAQLARLEERRLAGELMPLYGVPFAVKDNIDVAGAPTTAGCTAFARAASSSASVVARLM